MNNLGLLVLVCGGLVFGSGCATSFTQFSPPGVDADYTVTDTGLKTYWIYYRGGGSASEERIVDFALLRACHVARDQQCRYFAVINQTLSGSERFVYDPGARGIVLNPGAPLAIQCFFSRPKGVFVFRTTSLEAIIRQKYRPGESGATS